MSEVQFSFDALSFLQEVLPEPEEATPTDSIIRRPTEPKPVEAKDENQTMLQDFARLQADQYDLNSMKKAPPVKSNFIQEYLDSLDMFYKDEQMNEAINGALMEATRPPIGQLSETARTAMFSSADMRGTELAMMDNAREAQDVVQPMITSVSRGEQPEMADSPALVDAPSIDARSNEMLDKPVEQPVGIMARPDPQFNPIDKAIEEKTSNFYLKIGENAESDHGSTPVATNDASEKNKPLAQRSKDIGFGHKIKSSEEASGEIHGVRFKNEDGTYIPLTEEQKVFILNKDMEVQLDLARRTGWDTKLKKLGISWDDLDYKYQNALTSLAYNAKNAGKKWTAVLKAAKDKDPITFAKEMRRKDNKKYTSGMDNRVAKELYYAGIISSLDEVSSVLPLADATVAGLPKSGDSA